MRFSISPSCHSTSLLSPPACILLSPKSQPSSDWPPSLNHQSVTLSSSRWLLCWCAAPIPGVAFKSWPCFTSCPFNCLIVTMFTSYSIRHRHNPNSNLLPYADILWSENKQDTIWSHVDAPPNTPPSLHVVFFHSTGLSDFLDFFLFCFVFWKSRQHFLPNALSKAHE